MKLILATLLVALTAVQAQDYNPIQCSSNADCVCTGSGGPFCGKCPDDGGSPFVNDNVCVCAFGDGGGPRGTGFECDPLKSEGPAAAPAPTGDYNPITCSADSECACTGAGMPSCSLCSDDGGSPFVNTKVCVCAFGTGGGPRGTGFECDPAKAEGPKKAPPVGCKRRRRRRRL